MVGGDEVACKCDEIGIERVDDCYGVLNEARFVDRPEMKVGELGDGEVMEGRWEVGNEDVVADEGQMKTPWTPGVEARRGCGGQSDSGSG